MKPVLGFNAAVKLALYAIAVYAGGLVGNKLLDVEAVTYVGVQLLWLYYLLRREHAVSVKLPARAASELDDWNRILSSYVR